MYVRVLMNRPKSDDWRGKFENRREHKTKVDGAIVVVITEGRFNLAGRASVRDRAKHDGLLIKCSLAKFLGSLLINVQRCLHRKSAAHFPHDFPLVFLRELSPVSPIFHAREHTKLLLYLRARYNFLLPLLLLQKPTQLISGTCWPFLGRAERMKGNFLKVNFLQHTYSAKLYQSYTFQQIS